MCPNVIHRYILYIHTLNLKINIHTGSFKAVGLYSRKKTAESRQ